MLPYPLTTASCRSPRRDSVRDRKKACGPQDLVDQRSGEERGIQRERVPNLRVQRHRQFYRDFESCLATSGTQKLAETLFKRGGLQNVML